MHRCKLPKSCHNLRPALLDVQVEKADELRRWYVRKAVSASKKLAATLVSGAATVDSCRGLASKSGICRRRLVSSLTGMEFNWNIPLEFQLERRSRGLSLGVLFFIGCRIVIKDSTTSFGLIF